MFQEKDMFGYFSSLLLRPNSSLFRAQAPHWRASPQAAAPLAARPAAGTLGCAQLFGPRTGAGSETLRSRGKHFLANFRQNFIRFRLYRHRFFQENTRFAAFFKIYQIITFLQFGKILRILRHNICKILLNFHKNC